MSFAPPPHKVFPVCMSSNTFYTCEAPAPSSWWWCSPWCGQCGTSYTPPPPYPHRPPPPSWWHCYSLAVCPEHTPGLWSQVWEGWVAWLHPWLASKTILSRIGSYYDMAGWPSYTYQGSIPTYCVQYIASATFSLLGCNNKVLWVTSHLSS